MSTPVKILIVEDEMIIAAKISMHLEQMGYEVSGIVPRGEEAIVHCQQSPPDILLLDINLRGTMSGIDTGKAIQQQMDIAIVYLTANADQETFDLAKETQPYAFITKPYKKNELERVLALIAKRLEDVKTESESKDKSLPYLLDDRIFIRHKESMVKLFLAEICYIEANRSYCCIVTGKSQHLLSIPLKRLEEKLHAALFFRIHRSYIINLERIDEVSENHIVIAQKVIPIGKSYKENFLKRIQLI